MTQLTEEIRTRGHWDIRIRPQEFKERRIASYPLLESVISRTVVSRRGWDFPHVGRFEELRHGPNWLGQETDWEYYREAWRLYQSGLFAYLLGIHEDWAERSHGWGPPERYKEHGPLIGVGDTLFRFTEAFEFAARLAVTEAGDETMAIAIDIHGLEGRSLWVDDPNRGSMDRWYSAHFDIYPFSIAIPRSELVATSDELALNATIDFFYRFGWKPVTEVLRSQQAQKSRFVGYGWGGRLAVP